MNADRVRLSTLVELWNRFFFAETSPATIAVFRIAFGLLVLADGVLLFRLRRFAFAPDGPLSIEAQIAAHARQRFSLLHWLPPTMRSVHIVLALHFAGAVGIVLGLLTPLSIAIVAVTFTTIHHRNRYVVHAGDTLMRLFCMLLWFSHSNAALSLDARIWPSVAADQVSPWALRLMQILLASLYLKTAFWKLQGAEWRNGSAVYYALNFDAYERHALPDVLKRPWFYRAATFGTLGIELSLGSLVWIDELRYPVLLVGLGFHLTMDFLMNVSVFQWVMLCGLITFVDPHETAQLVSWVSHAIG